MDSSRRRILQAALASLCLPVAVRAEQSTASDMLIRINIPGPAALPFLPVELISSLNFDHEMGARLAVRYHPSGIRAIEDVLAGNADFAALGFPTLPVLHSRGKNVVAIAPLSGNTPPIAIMIRKDLARKVRRIADLKGLTIATSTGSINSKTYLQMAAQIVLGSHGVADNQVRWLPTAQNWESISGAMISKAADAVFCEEPFSSRLVAHHHAAMLADLSDPKVSANIPGFNLLRTAVVTSRGTLQHQSEKVEAFVRMLRRTLVWIQATPPPQVAEKSHANLTEAKQEIAALLKKIPGSYSPDGRFRTTQINATDVFLRAAMPDLKLVSADSLVDDRWAGRSQ